ncbi:TPA: hypothetical protein I8Z30_001537 [Legionella pneumophila]|nr:hypothetical protein [Legionella pneumophila]
MTKAISSSSNNPSSKNPTTETSKAAADLLPSLPIIPHLKIQPLKHAKPHTIEWLHKPPIIPHLKIQPLKPKNKWLGINSAINQ